MTNLLLETHYIDIPYQEITAKLKTLFYNSLVYLVPT